MSTSRSNITQLIFFCTTLLVTLSFSLRAQDEELGVFAPEKEQVVVDNGIPESAPLFFDEPVPMPDKDSIKTRLKKLSKNTVIPLTFNNTVYSFISYFAVRNREYSKMVLRRTEAFFPIFERILKENNMPDELKYLSIVESGLNPRARSRAGAVGLWQFVPATGESMNLKIDWYFDERQDPEKSTQAACKYLKYLYNRFGQWELALAAYNCGPTATARAVRACRNKRDFWEVYYHLPRETRSYVPQFIAVTYLMNHNKEHNLFAEYTEDGGNYHTLYTEQYINLDALAKQLDICVEDIQKLNPVLTKNIVPAYLKNFPLKIPSSSYHALMNNYCSIMDSCFKAGNDELVTDVNPFSEKAQTKASFTHLVKRGEILKKIAKKYHINVKELMTWNNLRSSKLKYGQKLVIWKEGYQKNEDKHKIARIENKPFKSKKTYLVQRGDTLWSISLKADIPLSKLKKLNRLKGNEVKPGQKLVLG